MKQNKALISIGMCFLLVLQLAHVAWIVETDAFSSAEGFFPDKENPHSSSYRPLNLTSYNRITEIHELDVCKNDTILHHLETGCETEYTRDESWWEAVDNDKFIYQKSNTNQLGGNNIIELDSKVYLGDEFMGLSYTSVSFVINLIYYRYEQEPYWRNISIYNFFNDEWDSKTDSVLPHGGEGESLSFSWTPVHSYWHYLNEDEGGWYWRFSWRSNATNDPLTYNIQEVWFQYANMLGDLPTYEMFPLFDAHLAVPEGTYPRVSDSFNLFLEESSDNAYFFETASVVISNHTWNEEFHFSYIGDAWRSSISASTLSRGNYTLYFEVSNVNSLEACAVSTLRIYADPPEPFTLNTTADPFLHPVPYITLTWETSENADFYEIYSSPDEIIEVTENTTLIASSLTNNSHDFTLEDGGYYFIVRAINDADFILSNSVLVNISARPFPFELTVSHAKILPLSPYYLNWTNSTNSHYYNVYIAPYFLSSPLDLTYFSETVKIRDELTTLSTRISGHFDEAIHYYIVVAFNEYGNFTSNCVNITITEEIDDDPNGIDDDPTDKEDPINWFLWIALLAGILSLVIIVDYLVLRIRRKRKPRTQPKNWIEPLH